MAGKPYSVLFLCTGNSARSILAEAMLNSLGGGRFRAFSAGSHPAGGVNPLAIELLEQKRVSTTDLRSKSWDEFVGTDAPRLDFVITVCDNAAGEVCPLWPGQPVTAHWGLPDPAAVSGSDDDRRRAFSSTWNVLSARIAQLVNLPLETLDDFAIRLHLAKIGGTAVVGKSL